MKFKRKRSIYFILVIFAMILGFSSRKFSYIFPGLINDYLGDIMWALMIFLGAGFVFSTNDTKTNVIIALVFSFLIEISQLYQGKWINNIRHTIIGGLILGYGFLWRDLISYTIGISIGGCLEKFIITGGE